MRRSIYLYQGNVVGGGSGRDIIQLVLDHLLDGESVGVGGLQQVFHAQINDHVPLEMVLGGIVNTVSCCCDPLVSNLQSETSLCSWYGGVSTRGVVSTR